ncbi:MAG: fatty acyl-AMP ligase [Actinobacteria bacterium]|jgi:fatty-acyl-CoA synthase|nr:MAG: fatty acyl-AMP ligase [Actinomycetota bacterium]
MRNARNVWQGICRGLSRSERGLNILLEEGEKTYTPGELKAAAERAALGLLKAGVVPGDRVGIMAQTTPSTVISFLACWAAGAVAVPLPLPMRAVEPRSFVEQSRRRLEKVEARLLTLPGSLIPMVGDMGDGLRLVASEELDRAGDMPPTPSTPGDTALVQFTSGSTSEPRGVILSHANIMANVRAITRKVKVTHRDCIVSWMPLYHDMGLIGFLITALAAGSSLILMSPQRFVADPAVWMRTISEYRATITGGPNFAFALSTRVLASGTAGDLDLSPLRLALNGAEPVDQEVMDGFVAAGEACGLRPEVPYPVYGLAEATLAVTFPQPGKRYRVDHVSRDGIEANGFARPAEPGEEGTRTLVSLGSPLEGIEVSVIKEDGSEAGEREVGEVCVRGDSVMQGYWADAAATAESLRGGSLHTGDLGYLAGGELYLVGRIKDMVIIGGRNLFPEDVERCVERVSGVRKGNAVAFGVTTRRGRERLVLVGETHLSCSRAAAEAARAVSSTVREEIGVPVREVVLVPAGSLPKTSSGKKRRFLCRDLYLGRQLQPVASSGAAVIGI